MEALLRWRHPERGLVGPEELLRVGRADPGDAAAHRPGAATRWWPSSRPGGTAGVPLRAAVNVSVRDLHAGGHRRPGRRAAARYGVPADLLQLEITESALMADPHRVLDTITRLDRMGVAISLDDFGTGYSSLQHLRRLPLSEVKIDRSFVLGMAADRGDAAIVRSVIGLAEALGLRAVAEGVEDEAHLAAAGGGRLPRRAGLVPRPADAGRGAGRVAGRYRPLCRVPAVPCPTSQRRPGTAAT